MKRLTFFLISDIVFIFLSFWLAFLLRFDGSMPSEFYPVLLRTCILAVIFHLPISYYFGIYSFTWAYVSARELIYLVAANTCSFIFLIVFLFLSDTLAGFPRSVLIIAYFLALFFSGAFRLSKRIYLQILQKNGKEKILIIGAGDAGEQVLRNIRNSDSPYFPAGLIDDNPFKKNSFIHGAKVLGEIDQIPEIALANQIEAVIIAFPSANTENIKRAVEKSRKAGIKNIKILPPLNELVNGQVSLADIKEFKIEDLLEREPQLHIPSSFIAGKTILITGAAGSIGSEICRQVLRCNPSKILLLDQDETGIFNINQEIKGAVPIVSDINDKQKIERLFNEFKPQIVFHAAAYKHVPLMEKDPEEAVKNNIFGTKIVAESALSNKAEVFVFISTDKAVNPTSVMGATKRVGEMICQSLNKNGFTKFISVRFGNVLGSRGSVVPIFQEQIKKGGPVEVTSEEMKRYFMTIPEAVGLVLQSAEMGRGGEVFVLDMGNPIRILDLANNLIRLSGLEPDKDIPIVFTGARPGEKLSEEILTAEEGVSATENNSIFVANLSSSLDLSAGLNNLKDAASRADRAGVINILRELVSSYNR